MKKILLILLFIPLLNYGQIKEDKIQHFTAGYFVAGAGYFGAHLFMSNHFKITQPKKAHAIGQIVGFGLGVLAGDLKERYDKSLGAKYDKNDLLATSLGAASFNITIDLFTKKEQRLIF